MITQKCVAFLIASWSLRWSRSVFFGPFLMMLLHKILPKFLLPTGLTVFLVLAGLLFNKPLLCWFGLAILWICSTPSVSWALMRFVEGRQVRLAVQEVPNAKAIVVLSAGLTAPPGDVSTIEWTAEAVNRFDAGMALFKAGKAAHVFFTGGWAQWQSVDRPKERALLVGRASDLGISEKHILMTGKVLNTADEACAIRQMLKDLQTITADELIILVTSAFHMRRSQLLFEREGLSVVAFPVDFKVSDEHVISLRDVFPTACSLHMTETALREWYGFLYYKLTR
jgi:uncharacterized SAM-binding protein YcdF (DUF218 family)